MTYWPGYSPDAAAGQGAAAQPAGLPFGPSQRSPGQRTRARVHVIWLIVAVLASLVAGSAGFAVGDAFASHRAAIDAAIGSAKAGARTGPCPTAPASGTVGQRLHSLLLARPAGSRLSSSAKTRAVLSLRGYVRVLYAGEASIGAQLRARCFQIAASRLWVTASGTIVSIYLAQFATAADARSYMLFTESGDLGLPSVTSHVPVPGVSDGLAVQHAKLDKYGDTFTDLLGDRGNVAIIIHVFVPARLPTLAQDRALLTAQRARA